MEKLNFLKITDIGTKGKKRGKEDWEVVVPLRTLSKIDLFRIMVKVYMIIERLMERGS